jgi:hypothetical protein
MSWTGWRSQRSRERRTGIHDFVIGVRLTCRPHTSSEEIVMRNVGTPAWMMAAFCAGIFFVYSCGGGGNVANADAALEARVIALEALLADITRENGGKTLRISGVNVQIVSGSGTTDDNGTLTGLGNLIIGYNADTGAGGADAGSRTGSHNLIVGDGHRYTKFGGLIAGFNNTISAAYAVVSGGQNSTASGNRSSVSGGTFNTASGESSSVSGGANNTASGINSSVSGGDGNSATVAAASVSGGHTCVSSALAGWTVGVRFPADGCSAASN